MDAGIPARNVGDVNKKGGSEAAFFVFGSIITSV
jgi:hypothetical protein